MTTVSQDIRGALQTRAATAAGFPALAQRKYEGRAFSPTTGTTHVRMWVIPADERPWSLRGDRHRHTGLFQIDVLCPSAGDPGTAAVEQLADAIKAVFSPDLGPMYAGDERVTVLRVERTGIMDEQPDWQKIVVTVFWSCFSARA